MTADHDRASELLPWYVNATLGAQETALVERHLEGCLECRKELERCQGLSAAVRSSVPEEWAPSAAHFAQVMRRVRAQEPGRFARLLSFVRDTPRPVRFVFALQAAAVIALTFVVVLRPAPRSYETLSRPPLQNPAGRARLHVVFAPDATESALRQVLGEAGAVIVDGPSAAGVYTVELPFPAADRERAAQVAARLGARREVRLATQVAQP